MQGLRTALLALMVTIGAAQIALAQQGLRALDADHEALGWEAVGRLNMPQGYCTATLIAPDLVLSAAHCVYDMQAGRLIPPEVMRFEAGWRNGRAAAVRKVAAYAAHPGFRPNGEVTFENVIHDLALVRLSEPIPTHEIDPFILHQEAIEPGPVSVVSYGRGREQVQSRERDCALVHRYDRLLAFDCQATFGTSGAPVFSHLNGRGRILSVISAVTMIGGARRSVGAYLPPLIEELKRTLRAQAVRPEAQARRIGVGEGSASGAKFVRAKP